MLAAALLLDIAAAAPRAPAARAAPSIAAVGNAQLGREKGEAERCFECHGVDGQGSPQSAESIFARLAGQSAGYIERQVRAFRGGLRASDSMRIPAREVGDADLRDIAAYFAALPPMRDADAPRGDAAAAGLASVGDASRGIAACASCHGDRGQGLPLLNAPRLAGQAARYLEKQLRDWRSGQRRDAGPASGVAAMAPVAATLTDKELAALARHYSSLNAGSP